MDQNNLHQDDSPARWAERAERLKLTRRRFLGFGSVAAATIGAASLAACTPQTPSGGTSGSPGAGGGGGGDYKAPPEPIAEADIAETIAADVVVVGAGMAGCNAAWSASEATSSVVVFQKYEKAFCHGGGIAGYGTRLQKDLGPEADFDVEEEINRWMRESEYRSDRKLVHRWAQFSGVALDRICDAIDSDDSPGLPAFYMYDPGYGTVYPDPWNFAYSGGIVMGAMDPEETESDGIGHMDRITDIILNQAVKNGAQVYFNTPAVQLVRDGDGTGRVSAVIAQKEDGSYIKCTAAKGVILAAGDYGHNEAMRAEYMPHIEGMRVSYSRDGNTGDGHLMGLWVGADIQKSPHAGNMHYDPGVAPAHNIAGSGCPWLYVNTLGERFCNEDASYGQLYAQDMMQPDLIHYQVFDGNYAEDVLAGKMGQGNQKNGPFPGFGMAYIDDAIAKGYVYQGETIEELAAAMEVPAEALQATVARYNELVDLGQDLDFGKQADRLTAIVKPPFYAILRQACLLCALGGLVINDKMEVIDKQRNVIPGLYAAGNNSGNWFGGLEHPMVIPGMSLGRAVVTGYLAGLSATGQEF
ncbi:MAG: FAD-dependent oxidoreductase [Bifidobacteriaceae bacterium]|jgi:fumarate reductase flavoprotein subunit|nr:FAD-dependent oxidoreductase [Bifidobacteriaceae bacterium]